MRKNLNLGVLVTLALIVTSLPAFGAEGRTPIWAPTVIPADGKYIVTRDIFAPPGSGPAIIIPGGGPEHVDIDLNGFTIFGDPAGSPAVIEAIGLFRSITIRNGEVRNLGPFGDAIHIVKAQKVIVEDVKTLDGDNGIHLEDCDNFALRRNSTQNSGLDGIRVTGFGLPAGTFMSGTIEDNNVSRSLGVGITLEAGHASCTVNNNRVQGTGAAGMFIGFGEGYIVAENTVLDGGGAGIHCEASNNSKIYNNVVHRSGGVGLLLRGLGGFLVLDNVSSGNTGDGLFTDGFINHIDRNLLNFNGGCGLHFAPGATANNYGRNEARFNGGCACAPTPADETCTPPYGGGAGAPDLCHEAPPFSNTSLCDNMLPGPPRS